MFVIRVRARGVRENRDRDIGRGSHEQRRRSRRFQIGSSVGTQDVFGNQRLPKGRTIQSWRSNPPCRNLSGIKADGKSHKARTRDTDSSSSIERAFENQRLGNSDLKLRPITHSPVIRLFAEFPNETYGIAFRDDSCCRSGTSVGAQYREASRDNPTPISSQDRRIVAGELEESEYWLELLGESGSFPEERLAGVRKETGELKGIFVSIVRNTKAKSQSLKR